MIRKRRRAVQGRYVEAVIIVLRVRLYLRYPFSFRHFEEIVAERKLGVDHFTSGAGSSGTLRN
jgi:transposase-like protein